MRVRLRIDKAAALRAGFNEHGLKVVEVDAASLTPEQRNVLAEFHHPRYGDKPEADFYLDSVDGAPDLATVGAAMVGDVLDAVAEHKAKKAAEAKAERDADVAALLARSAEEWVAADGSLYSWVGVVKIPDDPRLNWHKAEAQRLSERRKEEKAARDAEAKKEREREEAERLAKKEQGRVRLQAWAEQYGDALLKKRIAGQFEWVGLAEQQYAESIVASLGLTPSNDADVPDGYKCVAWDSRTTPTLAEMEALEFVKEKAERHIPAIGVKLGWAKYQPVVEDMDDSDDREWIERAEIEVSVTCLNGAVRTFDFLPESIVVAA